MQKTLDFLERHVQWFALGLGGLFLLLMAYFYLMTPPLTVKVTAGKAVTELQPGEVDSYIATNTLTKLKSAIDEKKQVKLDVPEHRQRDQEHRRRGGRPAAHDRRRRGSSRSGRAAPANVDRPRLDRQRKPVPGDKSEGQAMVAMTKPPAPGAEAVVPAVAPEDRDWTSWTFRVRMSAINDAFVAAHVEQSADTYRTQILRVEAFRQEKQLNGQWARRRRVAPLPTLDLPPLPAATADKVQQIEYLNWAASHLKDIVQPAFPADPAQWFYPGTAAPAEPEVAAQPRRATSAPLPSVIPPSMLPGANGKPKGIPCAAAAGPA